MINHNLGKVSRQAAAPPSADKPAPATARVDDVRVQHVEVVVAGVLPPGIAAGVEARWSVGSIELPVVVRRVEQVVKHVGGPVRTEVGLWVDPEFDEVVNQDAPSISGELVEASLTIDDAPAPVPVYEPNGTIYEDATLADSIVPGGDARLYIGGVVFNAVEGELQASWTTSVDADDDDEQYPDRADIQYRISGQLKPIGIESGRDKTEVILTIPLYPEFGRLYVDEPLAVSAAGGGK